MPGVGRQWRQGAYSPQCPGNPVFAGKEPNVSGYWGGLPGHVGVYVCVSLLTAIPSPSKCTQCARVFDQLLEVSARGLRSWWEHFQRQEQKPDREGELSIGLQLWCDLESRCCLVSL